MVVRRELCKGIRPGSKLTVVGVPTHRLASQSLQTYVDITIEVSPKSPDHQNDMFSVFFLKANNLFMEADIAHPLNSIPDSISDILKGILDMLCMYSCDCVF